MTAERRRADGSGRLVAGGSLLGVSMLVANAGNYALNLFLGRVLTPAEFSDANLMVTLLFTLTAVALCLQMIAARFVARADAQGFPGDSDDLLRRLRRVALIAGVALAAVFVLLAPVWSDVFRTASAWPFVVLGLGVPFWLVQAVGRGGLQARLAFPALALSFVVEMVTRVGLGIVLVLAGFGVVGATVALSVSFVVTCAVVVLASRRTRGGERSGIDGREVRGYAAMVSVLLIGQIIANNSDVLVSKIVLAPEQAGIYAAVALVGRAVFFLSWSVATVVFPVAVQRHSAGVDASSVKRNGILVVIAIGVVCAVGGFVAGGPVLGVVLGPEYGGLSAPIGAYALVTTLFAVANLVASYHLSRAEVAPSWVLVAGAVLQVALLAVWHGDIASLIAAQGVAMVALVAAVGAQAVWARRRGVRARPGIDVRETSR